MVEITRTGIISSRASNRTAQFKRQTALIRRAWPQNARADFDVAGANHLTVCDELADPQSPLFRATLALIRSV